MIIAVQVGTFHFSFKSSCIYHVINFGRSNFQCCKVLILNHIKF